MTSIGEYCFTGCGSLERVQLPSSLISIGWCAFCSFYEDKVPLKHVEIPKNCKIDYSFEDKCLVIRK